MASKLDIVVHGPQGPKSPPRFQVDLLFLILALFLCAATRPTFIIVNPQRLSVFKASKDVYITPFYPDPLSLQYSLKLLQRGSFFTFSAWKQAGPFEALQGKNPFLFVGNWHYTASQTLGSSKGKIQTVANQVREGMQKQRRSNQGTIEQPWGRVPVPSQGIYISNIFEFFSRNWGPTQVKDGHFRLSTRFLGLALLPHHQPTKRKSHPLHHLPQILPVKKLLSLKPSGSLFFVFCFSITLKAHRAQSESNSEIKPSSALCNIQILLNSKSPPHRRSSQKFFSRTAIYPVAEMPATGILKLLNTPGL